MGPEKWYLERLYSNQNYEPKERCVLQIGETLIGRHPTNQIRCKSIFASRKHCVLTYNDFGIFVRDENTSNGVFINAEKCMTARETKLNEGDVIGIGIEAVTHAQISEYHKADVFKLCKFTDQREIDTVQQSFQLKPKEHSIINKNPADASNQASTNNPTITDFPVCNKPNFTENIPPISKFVLENNELTVKKETDDMMTENSKTHCSENNVEDVVMLQDCLYQTKCNEPSTSFQTRIPSNSTSEEESSDSNRSNKSELIIIKQDNSVPVIEDAISVLSLSKSKVQEKNNEPSSLEFRSVNDGTTMSSNESNSKTVLSKHKASISFNEFNSINAVSKCKTITNSNESVLINSLTKRRASINVFDSKSSTIGTKRKASGSLDNEHQNKYLRRNSNNEKLHSLNNEPTNKTLSSSTKNNNHCANYTLEDDIIIISDTEEDLPHSQIFEDTFLEIKEEVDDDCDVEGLSDSDGLDDCEDEWLSKLSQSFNKSLEVNTNENAKETLANNAETLLETKSDKRKENIVFTTKNVISPEEWQSWSYLSSRLKDDPNDLVIDLVASIPEETTVGNEKHREIALKNKIILQKKLDVENQSKKHRKTKLTNPHVMQEKNKNRSKGMTKITETPNIDTKNIKEIRKANLRKLAEKAKPPVMKKSQTSKQTSNVKLTVKNRSDFLVDDLVKKSSTTTNNEKMLSSYKIPLNGKKEPNTINSNLGNKEDLNGLLSNNFLQSLNKKSDGITYSNLNDNKKYPNILSSNSSACNVQRKVINEKNEKTFIKSLLRNNSKTYVKKNVRFKEDEAIKEVRIYYVDKVGHRSVESNKDASPPEAIQNTRNVMDEVLYCICTWKIQWLEEEKLFPSLNPPPVHIGKGLQECTDEYSNCHDYKSTMVSLLLLELWSSISRAAKTMNNTFLFSLDKYKRHEEYRVKMGLLTEGCANRTLQHINIEVLLDDEDYKLNRYPRFGDFVLFQVHHRTSSQILKSHRAILSVFGYIFNAIPRKITHHTMANPELSKNYPKAKTILSLVVIVRGRNLALDPTFLGKIRVIKNITADLRQFTALNNLSFSPLKNIILQPKENEVKEISELPRLIEYEGMPILNEVQKSAVLTISKLCSEEKPTLHLIHGPPGTGKTQVIVGLIMQLWLTMGQKSKDFFRILLCAPSNSAVDELVLRLLNIRSNFSGRKKYRLLRNGRNDVIHAAVQGVSLESLRDKDIQKSMKMLQDPEALKIELELLTARINSTSEALRQYREGNCNSDEKRQRLMKKQQLLIEKKNNFFSQMDSNQIEPSVLRRMIAESENSLIEGANIIATTLASCYNSQMEKVFGKNNENNDFKCCIIDEATQASEIETLIPLLLKVNHVILVGDHKQLSATILNAKAKVLGFNKSLFHRHRMWWYRKELSWHSRNKLIHFLNTQYRMHPDIAHWPSTFFYNNLLLTDMKLKDSRKCELLPFVVLSHEFTQNQEGELNSGEVDLIKHLIKILKSRRGCKHFSVGVITPYNKQRSVLSNYCISTTFKEIEVGTVDSFQGKERDIIIFSCVRTDGIGFLNDPQRLNVALTRAKNSLIVCGNFKSLEGDHSWASLLRNAQERNLLKKVPSCLNDKNCFDLIKK
uniref:FHA domain-containing protein n=1 Tax=Clastoptera arizonana TaxID=38151 RepID=A0A1B6CQI3_9HEMI